MVAFTKEECDEIKHSLKQVGKKHDSMFYSMAVEGGIVFMADFKGTPLRLWHILNQVVTHYYGTVVELHQ